MKSAGTLSPPYIIGSHSHTITASSHLVPRIRVVAPGRAAAAQQPAAAVKPFAPVVENKEVELRFTISLEHARLSFDGSKKPKDKAD